MKKINQTEMRIEVGRLLNKKGNRLSSYQVKKLTKSGLLQPIYEGNRDIFYSIENIDQLKKRIVKIKELRGTLL